MAATCLSDSKHIESHAVRTQSWICSDYCNTRSRDSKSYDSIGLEEPSWEPYDSILGYATQCLSTSRRQTSILRGREIPNFILSGNKNENHASVYSTYFLLCLQVFSDLVARLPLGRNPALLLEDDLNTELVVRRDEESTKDTPSKTNGASIP